MSASRTVRAARLKEHGKPLVIKEVELREPREGEVLVELQFAGSHGIQRNNEIMQAPRTGEPY